MTRNWSDIEWIFETDGSLRDIYIQDVTLTEWEQLVDFLNLNYEIKFGQDEQNQIDKKYVLDYLKDGTGEMEGKILKINSNGIHFHCHFFLHNQIEFDIDPRQVKTTSDFKNIEHFMIAISRELKKQVTLTDENLPEFPLIKIDIENSINKVLTLKEVQELSEKQNSIMTKLTILKVKFMLRFFPRAFERRVLKSANKPYSATQKNKNAW
jgi:hypothetical protein